MIYPIPDPAMPFLGVHLTRMIDGSVTVGPNAVLALKREGYRKRDISLADTLEILTSPGIRRYCKTPALRTGRNEEFAVQKRLSAAGGKNTARA
ncbi:L-2-hydroxyglutarate oxidase [Klebsiella pneumoniae]|uniref:L-2-hydroxyglutarate oxidase n=1 Tax=Klebsiella pneumoniae TaxID=573 RepID=A0A377ZJ79_KLEPN|nr:L-2-hydroxyglutarate oxidase [Klebsiella pneumoniae]